MEKSLPHTVQRMVTTRQPKWSTASLPQILQIMRTSMKQERKAEGKKVRG